MSSIHTLAIRFADLWAVDHHQMVDEIYAPNIHMESMARLGHAATDGSAQLHALEDRLAAMIPAHRHELVRVIADDRHACLETTVVAPETGEYAPACVWWWPDGEQVGAEVGWFDWELRITDSRRSHGFVPPSDHRPRGNRQWYVTFADALASAVAADRSGAVSRLFAPDCVVEHTGEGPCPGASHLLAELPPSHSIVVNDVVADGAAIGVLFTVRTADLVSRWTAVLTLDALDKIASLRAYWRWSTAISFAAVHPSIQLERRPL